MFHLKRLKTTVKIKPWINLHFKYQEERIPYLVSMIEALSTWKVDDILVKIFVDENPNACELEKQLQSILPNLEIKQIDVNNEPMSLFIQHKNYISEFIQSDFTHFIFADADLHIDNCVFQYWLETRELFLKSSNYKYNFIPGTFRIEDFDNIKRSSDITYRTDINELAIVKIRDKYFFSPTEPFQDIGILDKDLAYEHLNLPYINDAYYFGYVGVHDFGYAETILSGHIFFNHSYFFTSRILYPLDDYEKCWYYHLPANYAANPDSEHGKIPAHEIFNEIKNRIKEK